MQTVNVKEARQHISRLLNAVMAGEEVVIVRRGKPVARLIQIDERETVTRCFPDRSELRRRLPSSKKSSTAMIREMRDERG
jgi:prevent-host-death family protein